MTAIRAHFDGRVFVPEEPLDWPANQVCRLLVLPGAEGAMDDQEPDEAEWMRAAAANPAFTFLKDPEEDIYLPTDGQPIIHAR
jgi:hypothetical protein